MDTNNFNSFEAFFDNILNFEECNPEGCEDYPGGFQELNPQLFALIGQLVAMAIGGKLPFNIQNAVGNWLTLVGQIIITFNAQQQYLQGGPGRVYDIKNKNVGNPFCQQSNTSNSTSQGSSSQNDTSEIEVLRCEVARLSREIEALKNKMD